MSGESCQSVNTRGVQVDVVEKAEWSGGEWTAGREGGATQTAEQTNLELGELEQLTINNDNDLNYDQVTYCTICWDNIYNLPLSPLDDVKRSFSQDLGGKVHAPVSL